MPASVLHSLSMTTPDDPAFENKPSNWNESHLVTLNVAATEISALFSNANGVSWGLDGTNITASVGAAGAGLTNINVSAGTTSNNLSALTFGNANGVSFGLNGSVVTGSHNAITTGRASTDALGLATAASNVTWTANSAGVSIDARGYAGTATTFNGANVSGSMTFNSAGLNLSLSAAAPGGGANVNISAGTTSNDLTALTFADGNGLAFGLNGSVITGSYTQSTHSHSTGPGALAAGTQTGTSGTFVFANSNNFTFGMSGSSQVTASFSESTHSHSTAPGAIAAGTQTGTSGTIAFANSNGITFGMSGSTQITASHNGLTTARASNDAIGLNTAQSNVTWTVNSAGLSLDARGYAGTGTSATNASITLNSNGLAISVAAPGAGGAVRVSAGTTSNDLTQLVFSNSHGHSFGLNGSTITVSQDAASCFRQITFLTTGGTAQGNSLVSVQPFYLDRALVFSNVLLPISANVATAANNSSAYFDLSMSGVIYTRNVSSLSSVASFSNTMTQTYSSNATGTVTGVIGVTATLAQTTLQAGEYWIAFHLSTNNTATGGANTTALGKSITAVLAGTFGTGANLIKAWGGQTASSQAFIGGQGIISTGATMASINFNAIIQSANTVILAGNAFELRNNTYQI